MAHSACLGCLVSTISGRWKITLDAQALVAGTKQSLSNLLFLDIYAKSQEK
jgi:hypothetical protein